MIDVHFFYTHAFFFPFRGPFLAPFSQQDAECDEPVARCFRPALLTTWTKPRANQVQLFQCSNIYLVICKPQSKNSIDQDPSLESDCSLARQ